MRTVFKERYEEVIRPKLIKEEGYRNLHQVPRIEKIVLNMGLGARPQQDKNFLEMATQALATISGQHPCITYAKKSIAGFKVRQGMPLGLKVTLRAQRAEEFLHRLITMAMPRIRDFRGVSPHGFDGHGNFTMGIKGYDIFHEIDYDKIGEILGMNITIVTTATENGPARKLLAEFGMPFKKDRG